MNSWLDIKGLAELTGSSVSTIEKAVSRRSIPFTWFCGRVRFTPDDVAEIERMGKEQPIDAIQPLRLVSGPRPPAGPPVPRPPAAPPTPSKGRAKAS